MANTPPPTFALTPGVLNTAIIDYDDKAGRKLFEAATKKLGETFDGTSNKTMVLQEELTRKATDFGWNNKDTSDIINIAPNAAVAGNTCDLIQEYSQLSVEVLNTWAMNNIVNQQNTCQVQSEVHSIADNIGIVTYLHGDRIQNTSAPFRIAGDLTYLPFIAHQEIPNIKPIKAPFKMP